MQIQIENPIDRAARAMGGRDRLADALHVTISAIGNWKSRGVPLDQCAKLERATAGTVTRRDLRPKDWRDIWPELADPTPPTTEQPATAGAT